MVAELWLVHKLLRRGYNRRQIWQLFRFIDWIMALPEKLEDRFWTEVATLTKEKRMPYVTSLEQGLALMSEVQELHDEGLLIQIQGALVSGLDLAAIRKIWQA